jgi:hypothetical protein
MDQFMGEYGSAVKGESGDDKTEPLPQRKERRGPSPIKACDANDERQQEIGPIDGRTVSAQVGHDSLHLGNQMVRFHRRASHSGTQACRPTVAGHC